MEGGRPRRDGVGRRRKDTEGVTSRGIGGRHYFLNWTIEDTDLRATDPACCPGLGDASTEGVERGRREWCRSATRRLDQKDEKEHGRQMFRHLGTSSRPMSTHRNG